MEIEVTKQTVCEWVVLICGGGEVIFNDKQAAEYYCDSLENRGIEFKLKLQLSS